MEKRKSILEQTGAGKRKPLWLLNFILVPVFIIAPFLTCGVDYAIVQIAWYLSAVYFSFSVVLDRLKKKKCFFSPEFELLGKQGEILALIIFPSIFVLNYYEIDYIWYWVIFLVMAMYVPYYLRTIAKFDEERNARTESEKKTVGLNIAKHTVCFWLFDLFFCACFNGWEGLTYVLGIISIVIILWNASEAFLAGNKQFRGLLPFEFLVGVGLAVYLIHSISDTNLREIILAITAAIFGGLFTLIGVAWTIKKGELDRQMDLRRVEEERREEERKKYMPFLKVASKGSSQDSVRTISIRGLNLNDGLRIKLLNENTVYHVRIKDFTIKNISKECVILKGIIVQGEKHLFLKEKIIEPGGFCTVETTKNSSVTFAELDNSMGLIVDDILRNSYFLECDIDKDGSYSGSLKCEYGEIPAFSYTYTVKGLGLPVRDSHQ